MDARLSLLIALPLALAACSSPPNTQPPVKKSGLEVFELVINEPAAPDSIIRQGDQITYIIAPTPSAPWFARFDASCSMQPVGSMFYNTDKGMKAFSEKGEFPSLPQAQLQVLLRSEQLKNACAYRPAADWRALDTTAGQDWLVLDRNSAIHENGLLKIWTGRQLAEYQVSARETLIGEVQERLAIDCAARTSKRLSQFKVDATGRVFTGQIDTPEQVLAPFKADSGQQRLIESACQPAATWAQLAKPPERKPLMPQLATPKAAPAVVAAIDALQLPPARLTLNSLQYSYDALMLNGIKITDVQRKDVFTRDKQSGQLLVQSTDAVLGTKLSLTSRGLFDLASRSFDRKSGEQVDDKLRITDVSFKGDWQHLPANSEVAYSLTQGSVMKPHTSTITCKVGAARQASQITPALQGMAKPVLCTRLKTARMEWTQSFNYLEDYGVFVQDVENSPLGRWTWRVVSTD